LGFQVEGLGVRGLGEAAWEAAGRTLQEIRASLLEVRPLPSEEGTL